MKLGIQSFAPHVLQTLGREHTAEQASGSVAILREAGLPPGVLQVLMGDGQTGAHLTEAGVDKISFTGSVRTGRVIADLVSGREPEIDASPLGMARYR